MAKKPKTETPLPSRPFTGNLGTAFFSSYSPTYTTSITQAELALIAAVRKIEEWRTVYEYGITITGNAEGWEVHILAETDNCGLDCTSAFMPTLAEAVGLVQEVIK